MYKLGVVVDNDFYNDVRVVNEVKILASTISEVHILCFNFGREIEIGLPNNVYVHPVKINRLVKNIIFAYNNTFHFYTMYWSILIKLFIKKTNVESIHVHDLYLSQAAYWATRKSKINFTLDLHENFPAAVTGYQWMYKKPHYYFIKPDYFRKKEGKYLNYADKIVVLSETFKNDLIDKHSVLKNKTFCIYPNLPDIDEFNNYEVDSGILDKKSDFILFYFGGIAERRGVFTAIEAIKKLKHEIPNIKLLLIGPVDKAEKERFYNVITNEEVIDHIIYYEWKDISLLPSYVNISDVCLSPIVRNDQHESGVANKIFQYMLFERPLLVSDCKPQKHIVESENCGLAFESENVVDLANKVLELYKDPELRMAMGINGKNAVLEKYNTSVMGRNLIDMYIN